MKRSEILKEQIKAQYKSVSNFCKTIGIKPSTLNSAFERDLSGTDIDLIITICEILNLDVKTFEPVKVNITELSEQEKKLILIFRLLHSAEKAKYLNVIEYKIEQLHANNKKILL